MEETVNNSKELKSTQSSRCNDKDEAIRDSDGENDSENYMEISLQKRPLVQKMIFDDRKRKIRKIIFEEDEYLNKRRNLNNNNNEAVSDKCNVNESSIFEKSFKNDLKGKSDVQLENDGFTVKTEFVASVIEIVKTEYEDLEPYQNDDFSHLPLELRPGVDRRHKVACVPEAKSLLERRKRRRETKERGFLCKDCHKLLPSFAELKKHVIVHQVETKHKCPECGKCFQRSCDLTLHRRVHSASKPHVCTVCRRAFTQKINMMRHMHIHTDSRPYKCDVCPRAFISRPELDRHYRRHEGPMPHYCSVCKDRFLTLSELRHHVTTLGHEIGRALCSICGLLCNDKDARDAHVKETHKKERKAFQCHDCRKKYSTKLGVTRHILSQHGNDGRFGCQFCGAHFYGDSSLQAHLKRHAGARDYPCNQCDKTFYSATTLNRHQRSHTNERPFPCDMCDRAFKAADARKRHQLSVHDRSKPTHACQTQGCTEVFTSRSNMLRHVRSRHYGIKPYKCDKCSDRFTSNTSLQYHLQRINKCTESVKKKRKSRKKKIEDVEEFLVAKNNEITKTDGEPLKSSSTKKKGSSVKKVKRQQKTEISSQQEVSETNKSKEVGETVNKNVKSKTFEIKKENYDEQMCSTVGETMIESSSSKNFTIKSDILNNLEIKKEIIEENEIETLYAYMLSTGNVENTANREIKEENKIETLCENMLTLGNIEITVKREIIK